MITLEKWQLHILAHLIKRPNNWLVCGPYIFIPPLFEGPYFKHATDWSQCRCPMCKNCGSYVSKSFVKFLVKEGFLQRHVHIRQKLNGSQRRYIRWTFVPEAVEQIPELKELMVQVAIDSI